MSFFVPIGLYDNFGFECKKLIGKTLIIAFLLLTIPTFGFFISVRIKLFSIYFICSYVLYFYSRLAKDKIFAWMKSTISTKTIGNLLLADNTVTGALFRMGVVQFWCSFDILIGFWMNEWIESKRSFHVSYRTPTEDDFKLFDKQSNGGGHGKSSGTNFLLICSKFKQFPSKRQVYFLSSSLMILKVNQLTII